MVTWSSGYSCSDCGREVEKPGTCNDCLVKEQQVDQAIRRDIAKTAKGKPKQERRAKRK